jgi:hypothetical protein
VTVAAGSLLLVVEAGALAIGSACLAATAGVRSPVSLLLRTYVFGWVLVVVFAFVLSPVHAVTRTAAFAASSLVLVAGVAVWARSGRALPAASSFRAPLRDASRDRAVLVSAVAAAVALVYAAALAVATRRSGSSTTPSATSRTRPTFAST